MDAEIKTKEVDIYIDDHPKLSNIRDYWIEEQITETVNLLKEYQDVFAKDYKYLKDIVQEMGEMKIELLPYAKPVKKRPYKLSHKYKGIVRKEIDNILKVGIIYLV